VYGPGAQVEMLLDAGLPDLAWQVWEPLLAGAERIGPL
jgi:exodeoxyribonuclease V gamma subunit